ncbi:hypothetical protein [Nesterenkonia sp. AN1]|uniref:hypothetical protein n=1 Tax=Nesterenkonia sp. AN1 TaxID=652017 RepID=UPI001F1FDAFC|nr:hypothetical protein [Nesterenkonia sp. AN1]
MTSQPRHRRPRYTEPATFDQREGGADPAIISQAAHDTAHALVFHGRDSDDPEVTERSSGWPRPKASKRSPSSGQIPRRTPWPVASGGSTRSEPR